MSLPTQQQLESAVDAWVVPGLAQSVGQFDARSMAKVQATSLQVELTFGFPCDGVKTDWAAALAAFLRNSFQLAADVKVSWQVVPHAAQGNLLNMQNVKNIVAVASGKGGVGKSTTAVNLALALAKEGARVGILDADIYGPSQPLMLGIPAGTKPQVSDNAWIPVPALGLQTISMGFLVEEQTPMVWRGPMVSGALQQLLTQTMWNNLDYLIVDMPPGTGDIQLTLAQKVPVSGAVIVTTPQDIALLDAKKGIEMFRKVDVPVLGVVENMAIHICSNCGHAEHIFGEGGGERIAKLYHAPLLGSLPLAMEIREQADSGLPTVAAAPESKLALIYRDIARKTAALLSQRAKAAGAAGPRIVVQNT